MNLIKVLALAVLLLSTKLSAETDVLVPSKLQGNEVIKITLTSTGCFHHYTKLYELRSGKEGSFIEVSDLRQKWDEDKKVLVVLGEEKLGRLELTQEERQGLDALFVFYRHKYDGGCTTSDSVRVAYERAGKTVGSEEFTDTTCLLSMVEHILKDEKMRGELAADYDLVLLEKVVPLQKIERRLKPKSSR